MDVLRTTTARRAALFGALCAVFGLFLGGCGPRVDMTGIYEPTQAHTTIAYDGVQEESRLYPDYGAIRGDILSPEAQGRGAP